MFSNSVLSEQWIGRRRRLGNELTDKIVKQGANYQGIQQYHCAEP